MVRTPALPLQGAQAQSLVGELRSRKPWGAAKKKKKERNMKKRKKERLIRSFSFDDQDSTLIFLPMFAG